jgi:hypothetical protein
MGGLQRRCCKLSNGQKIPVKNYDAPSGSPLSTLSIEIDMLAKKRNPDPVEIDAPEFEKMFQQNFTNQVFGPGQEVRLTTYRALQCVVMIVASFCRLRWILQARLSK